MPKLNFFGGTFALVEVVHVELANKGVDVAVLEVVWKRVIREVGLVEHLETLTVRVPLDDSPRTDRIQDLVQFLQECRYRLYSLFFLI